MNLFSQQRPGNEMTFWEKMELAERLAHIPALFYILGTRKDVGCRIANPLWATICALLILSLIYTSNQELEQLILFFFAIHVFSWSFFHRFHRWREARKGKMQHSYYLGTSTFDYRWLPDSVRRNRKMARLFDPIFFGTIGLLLFVYMPAVGGWLAFSAMCLRIVEDKAWRKHREEQLDIVDSLIVSGVHAETVERFNPPPAQVSAPQSYSDGIPTGLGADIQHKISQRRKPSK